ncbi:MAG: hypothetical protein IJO29_07355 [Oscillospiraceae bacterium]|nr:hypothetical protein [Oscillospiraceae bacterium]
MTSDKNKEWAVFVLQSKSKELERLPKKEDFDDSTRSRIKAFLGPWPRALETAGLKEPSRKQGACSKRRRAGKKKSEKPSEGKCR